MFDDFSPDSDSFIDQLRCRSASSAITPSAARNMGKKGLVQQSRSVLRDSVDLTVLHLANSDSFQTFLNSHTSKLQRRMRPYLRGNRTGWGPARKFLNIYLRDCFYNHYLRNAFRLEHLESMLEVPLDSDVMSYLAEQPEGTELPKHIPVSALNLRASRGFQKAAVEVAKRMNTSPVHLDVVAWRRESLLT